MIEPDERRDDERARSLLRNLPLPPVGAEARARAGIVAAMAAPTARSPVRWAVPGVAVAAAAAIAAVVSWPAAPPPAVPLARTLAAASSPVVVDDIPHVHLLADGEGSVAGDTRAPAIQWESGTIDVEVDPGQGINLSVTTRDGRVRVVGTGFSVARTPLGTQVDVRHGKVETTCVGEAPVFVEAGGAHTCLPTTPTGMLTRASTLERTGAAPDEILAACDRGLAMADAKPYVRDGLRVLRITSLVKAGRSEEALAEARAFLASGGSTRQMEVLRLAADLAMKQGGCAAAAPELARLAAQPAPEDAARLAACPAHP